MDNQPKPKLCEHFPAWRGATAFPDEGRWSIEADWEGDRFLPLLLEMLEDELQARNQRPPEEVSTFGAAVLGDLVAGAAASVPGVGVQRNFLRLFLAAKMAEYSQMYGRSSLAFDWLLCAVSDRPWVAVEPGEALEVDYYPARLGQFVLSRIPVISGTAPWAVISFVRSLYYYSWKEGGLRELAEMVLEDAQLLVTGAMGRGDADLKLLGVEAAAAMATWCLQGGRPEATTVVRAIAALYDRSDTSDEARKLIAITLATIVWERSGQPSVEWAKRALANHGPLLVQHERVQMLIASCATPDEMVEKFDVILAAVEDFASESDRHYAADRADIAFRRIQLFDLFAPFVVGLVRRGQCARSIAATAAWFSVPPQRRRRSPALALLPGLAEGVMYATEGLTPVFERDAGAANRQLVEAVNHAFDMNIVVRDDHSVPARPKTGRRGELSRYGDELAEATASYYELDRAADAIAQTAGLALFQAHTVHAPLLPLVRSRHGVTWPVVTSFEEPLPDRRIRKAFIWSYGTYFGGYEVRAVTSILEAAGVQCVALVDRELTPDEFLQYYNDDSFDLVWVTAHGMFDNREPHRAHIASSSDGANPTRLTDLLRHPVRGPERRLLFLNICLGASVVVTEAPPKLGLGAMLAAAEQAVVSHMAEVSIFVAPLFGVAAAIALARGASFFEAFCSALDAVRLERPDAVELVRQAAPQCVEFLDWLQNGTYGVNPGDIRTWGTGAFYE